MPAGVQAGDRGVAEPQAIGVDRSGLTGGVAECDDRPERRAGVGKTTIYRWWPSKSAVVLDALQQRFEPKLAFPDTGSVRGDLVRQVRAVIRLLRTAAGQAYLTLVAESRHDEALADALNERYLTGRRESAAEVVHDPPPLSYADRVVDQTLAGVLAG